MKMGNADRRPREADPLEFDVQPQAKPANMGSVAMQIGTKNLLIIIVTMPFVFLVVVMSIIALFGDPKKHKTADAAPAAALEQPAVAGQRVVLPMPASVAGAPGAIALPQGATAGALALDGDRLAVRVDTEGGAMIVIYDLKQGAVVETVPLVEAGSREE